MTAERVSISGDLGAPVIRRAVGVTIDQIVQDWLDAQRASVRTRRADAVASFRAALQAAGHDLDATLEAVALAAQAWAGQGDAAAATYNRRLACVSSCFRYAIRHGLLRGENPIAHVQRQRVQAYGKAVALTPAAVRHKLQASTGRRTRCSRRGCCPISKKIYCYSTMNERRRRCSSDCSFR